MLALVHVKNPSNFSLVFSNLAKIQNTYLYFAGFMNFAFADGAS